MSSQSNSTTTTRKMRNPEAWVGKTLPKNLDCSSIFHGVAKYDLCDNCQRLFRVDDLHALVQPICESDWAIQEACRVEEAMGFCPDCLEEIEDQADRIDPEWRNKHNAAIFGETTPTEDDDPTDPNPTAPAALLLLPAPSRDALKAARRERAQARERVLRRKAAAARLMRGGITQYNAVSLFAIALPAGAGEIVETGYRELTSTIRSQQKIEAMAETSTGNPHDAWRKLMDAYLEKQAAKQVQVIGGAVAA